MEAWYSCCHPLLFMTILSFCLFVVSMLHLEIHTGVLLPVVVVFTCLKFLALFWCLVCFDDWHGFNVLQLKCLNGLSVPHCHYHDKLSCNHWAVSICVNLACKVLHPLSCNIWILCLMWVLMYSMSTIHGHVNWLCRVPICIHVVISSTLHWLHLPCQCCGRPGWLSRLPFHLDFRASKVNPAQHIVLCPWVLLEMMVLVAICFVLWYIWHALWFPCPWRGYCLYKSSSRRCIILGSMLLVALMCSFAIAIGGVEVLPLTLDSILPCPHIAF